MICPHCEEKIASVNVEAWPMDRNENDSPTRMAFDVNEKGEFTKGSPDNVWATWSAECPRCGETLDQFAPTTPSGAPKSNEPYTRPPLLPTRSTYYPRT